jgi:hypothetical protein
MKHAFFEVRSCCMNQLESDQFVTALFKPSDDFSDKPTVHTVGLQSCESHDE